MVANWFASVACSVFLIQFLVASTNVVNLSKKFQDAVMDKDDAWLVIFSESSAVDNDEFDKVASKLSIYGVNVGFFDCSESKSAKKICQQQTNSVGSSINLFTNLPSLNPYTQKKYRGATAILGNMAASSREIEKFVSKAYPSNHISVTDSTIDTDEKIPTLVLFSEKSGVTLLFKSICWHFAQHGQLKCVQVSKQSSLVEKYEIEKFPTIGLISNEGIQIYDAGGLERPKILNWLKSFVVSNQNSASPEETKTKANVAESAVLRLQNSFTVDVLSSSFSWVVGVFNVQSEVESKEWQDLTAWSDGFIKSAEVICSNVTIGESDVLSDHLCKSETALSPYLQVLPMGEIGRKIASSKSKLKLHRFDLSEHSQARTALAESLPETSIKILNNEQEMQNFLAENHNNGVMSLVLLSEKPSPPPSLRNVALMRKEFAGVGFFNPSPAFLANVGNPKLPTAVAMFLQNSNGDGTSGFQVINYEAQAFGPLQSKSLSQFIVFAFSRSGMKAAERPGTTIDIDGTTQGEVIAVQSEEEWLKACSKEFRGICAIALLRGNENSAVMDRTLAAMGSSAAAFRFLTVDGYCARSSFLDSFESSYSEVPLVVAFSPSKSRFVAYRGMFTEEGIRAFLDSVVLGKMATKAIQRPVFTTCEQPDLEINEPVDEVDASDFLEEIKREEEERQKAIKKEIEEDQRREREAAENAIKQKKTKKSKKSKKGKKSKSSDEL